MTQPNSLSVERFYDDLAAHYHLLFKDWPQACREQGRLFDKILRSRLGEGPFTLLDAACGIGTQALGLAQLGHRVRGTDLSPASILRARREAERSGIKASFGVADLRSLSGYVAGPFDAVLAADNALPHLDPGRELQEALQQVASVLKPGGLFIATLRDYETLLESRPRSTRPRVHDDPDGLRRILFQVWDWEEGGTAYAVTQYILLERAANRESMSFTSHYNALTRAALDRALSGAGFARSEWLSAEESGYYQPVVVAHMA